MASALQPARRTPRPGRVADRGLCARGAGGNRPWSFRRRPSWSASISGHDPQGDITYLRFAFGGEVGEHEPAGALDVRHSARGVDDARRNSRCRGSPSQPAGLAMREDYLVGRRYPLELIRHYDDAAPVHFVAACCLRPASLGQTRCHRLLQLRMHYRGGGFFRERLAHWRRAADVGNSRVRRSGSAGCCPWWWAAFTSWAGQQTPIHADRGGNFDDQGVHGAMDCIDHSDHHHELPAPAGKAWGALRFHRVLEPAQRGWMFQHFRRRSRRSVPS
jgi:hypothetical protein